MPEGLGDIVADVEFPSIKAVTVDRNTSTIGFPYAHMEDTIHVARVMLDQGGVPLSRDQLEAAMAATGKGGNFPIKFGSARMFGFIQRNQQGRFYLTEIGHAILSTDGGQNAAARRDAFLNIPLYKRTFVEFRNTPLPARPTGLENAFVQMGVAPKQKEKARWAFEKSAHFAGFFKYGDNQLVEPIISNSGGVALPQIQSDETVNVADNSGRQASSTNPMLEPLIHGLLIRLPEVGSDWPPERRVRWLQLLANVFDVVYAGTEDLKESDKHIEVKISSARTS